MKIGNAVLIVEDNEISRLTLKNLLQKEYNIIEAENGREALVELKAHSDEIVAITLDLIMPVMDGYEFLLEMRNFPEYRNIPIIVTTADDNAEVERQCLQLGVWDFVIKPFNPTIINFRIRNAVERSRLMRSELDSLTGLYGKEKFFRLTAQMLHEHKEEDFAFLYLNMDGFNMINSFYGMAEGDKVLVYLAKGLTEYNKSFVYSTYGRMEADTFCCCIPYDQKKIDQIATRLHDYLDGFSSDYYLMPSVGVYRITDHDERVASIYEKAALAAKQCKGKYDQIVAFYDAAMREDLAKEQHIINEMESALAEGQFEVYLQPKYDLKTNRSYGAEALVRWNHPEKGLVSPGDFIPIFERNGFVVKLDFYMWESVCKMLRRWKEQGRVLYPISVNVSRVNVYNPHMVDNLINLVRKYDVDPAYLNLELTESAFVDNKELVKESMDRLHSYGFKIMMDDFGSGYSSLSVLKNINVDYLKIDMEFLPVGRETEGDRSLKILTSVVKMAKWLAIPVIIEGVESQEQVDFLRGIYCEYIQGYYYARPMPISEFEKLVDQEQTEK